MLDEIKTLIESLPYVEIHGAKHIRFDEPIMVTCQPHVYGVMIDEDGEVQILDEDETWHYLEVYDGVLANIVAEWLKALQVQITPTINRCL